MTEPIRSCIGCGRKGPQHEFLRFVAANGVLIQRTGQPGRGAYTCRRLSCFERAISRRAFNRALRQTVRVQPELSSLYT